MTKSRADGLPGEMGNGLSAGERRRILRLHQPKLRERDRRVLVEGVRAVGQALRDGASPLLAVRSPRLSSVGGGAGIAQALEQAGVPVRDASDAELRELSATESPQGLLMVTEQPVPAALEAFHPHEGVLLVLDQVQDPGNVGALVRSARALGATAVLLLDGSADPWSPKAVRAGAGTGFGIPLLRDDVAGWQRFVSERAPAVLVADADGQDIRTFMSSLGRCALVLGNEGAGVRPALRGPGARSVAVPLDHGVESLNVAVAGSLLLYAIRSPVPSDPS